jgi:hypothetical protein
MHRICCLARRHRAVRVYRAGNACAQASPCTAAGGGRRGRGVASVASASICPQEGNTPTQSRDCTGLNCNPAAKQQKCGPHAARREGHTAANRLMWKPQ